MPLLWMLSALMLGEVGKESGYCGSLGGIWGGCPVGLFNRSVLGLDTLKIEGSFGEKWLTNKTKSLRTLSWNGSIPLEDSQQFNKNTLRRFKESILFNRYHHEWVTHHPHWCCKESMTNFWSRAPNYVLRIYRYSLLEIIGSMKSEEKNLCL